MTFTINWANYCQRIAKALSAIAWLELISLQTNANSIFRRNSIEFWDQSDDCPIWALSVSKHLRFGKINRLDAFFFDLSDASVHYPNQCCFQPPINYFCIPYSSTLIVFFIAFNVTRTLPLLSEFHQTADFVPERYGAWGRQQKIHNRLQYQLLRLISCSLYLS